MPALYYGNPETLKEMNRNILSMTNDGTWGAQVAIWDAIVKPVIEGHLWSIFSSWPAAASTDQNAISTLWHLAMTLYIQKGKFATNTTGQQSAYGGDIGEQYTQLLLQIQRGEVVVPGATRGSVPRSSAFALPRWTISEDNQPDEPQGVGDVFPKGTRR